MNAPSVYRTERGLVWRVIETDEGWMRVEMLKAGDWVPGSIGMVGLRLSPSTIRLTPEQVRGLPE